MKTLEDRDLARRGGAGRTIAAVAEEIAQRDPATGRSESIFDALEDVFGAARWHHSRARGRDDAALPEEDDAHTCV